MRKLLSFLAAALLTAVAVRGQDPCHIVITGDFDSQCLYDSKDTPQPIDEYPTVMVACQHSTVTYTAHIDPALTATSFTWEVTGDVTHSAAGNQLTVTWGNTGWGLLVVTVTATDGIATASCTSSAYVKLVAAPTAAAATVPAYFVNEYGDKIIRVCRGGRVEFIDHSSDDGSDIAGHHWECTLSAPSSTPNYVIDPVTADDVVTHRVYNNCGCYGEEEYHIEVLQGGLLELDCYGTACEGSVVTYVANNPLCDEYCWHVEGGTLVAGQNSDKPTVQWDRPQEGYGVLSLDGVRCGVDVCPTMMSVKVPVIQDGLAIEGPRSVCLGESAVFRLPLFGSTRYDWTITPSVTGQSVLDYSNEMRYTFTNAGTYKISVSYRCDFLGCGPCKSEEFTVTVGPNLSIVGPDQICSANSCNLHTDPAVAATWQAYDLGNANLPVGAAVTGTTYSRTFSPGRYLVTAEHPGHCGPATFVLNVKDVPPAPTVDDLSPANLHSACPLGGICLTGTPSEAGYSLVWAPACSTATPQLYTGDSVNISYSSDVCDVRVYNYDRVLQCLSTNYYVHTVAALTPAATTLPTSITVCPNSIVSFHDMVPDQRRDGMLYEWKIQDNMQQCASVRGSHQQPDATWLVNETNLTMPYSFNVLLTRSYCSTQSTTDIVTVTVRDNLSVSPLSVSGPLDVCVGESASYTCTGCPTGELTREYTFHQEGLSHVEFHCNPYDFCDNSNLFLNASVNVNVHPLPQAQIDYDESTNTLTVDAGSGTYSYDWHYTDMYGVTDPTSLGTTNSIQPTVNGYYSCTVTDLTPCSVTVEYYIGPVETCDPMTLGHASYDNCDHSIRVTSPYHSRAVDWTVDGGGYEIHKSGDHNYIADVTFTDVGDYTICARTQMPFPAEGCYKGCHTCSVDFVRDFRFSCQCSKITIVNESKYIHGFNNVYITVTNNCNNTVEYISFPVSHASYTYIPNPAPGGECTYTFVLTGYGTNGNIYNCTLGSATIGMNSVPGPPVSITTSNQHDTPPNFTTCDNTPIQLTATLNYPNATIVSSNWSFGDGGSYSTEGNSVYHTFKEGNRNVSVTVTDSRGCSRSSSVIYIMSYQDILGNGKLETHYGPYCPHLTPPIQEIRFTPNDPTNNHYTWTPPLSGTTYQNYVSEPGVYSVSVVNNHFCQKEGAAYVPFLPCPTARIHAENFNCCEGEPIQLYGSMNPATGMQYLWSIATAGYSETFATGDIIFTPPAAGTYNVTLTVTDNYTACSSTAHATVTAHSKPAAPTLSFVNDSCISGAPVQLTATGCGGELHWSNGTTGTSALYYTPGFATAYCFDPSMGCSSDEGIIRIHRQPDFDALLTGCYEKCQGFLLSYQLPVYGLTPDTINWRWYHNGSVLASGNNSAMPLSLPLYRPGTFRLEADYQNGGCHAVSPNLTIAEKNVCDCDGIQITSLKVLTDVANCKVYYTIPLKVCNMNDGLFCITGLKILSDVNNIQIVSNGCTGHHVAANSCETLYLVLEAASLMPSSVLLQITDDSCMHCTKQFSVDLKEQVECEKTIQDARISRQKELSNDAAAYYLFEVSLPKECRIMAVWSEPEMVLDYSFNSASGILTSLNMYDRAVLSQIADTNGMVCFRAILCCSDELCVYSYCIAAETLLRISERASDDSTDSSERYAPRPAGAERSTLGLAGNPTTGDVSVVGTADDIIEVVVMDMHGRRVARYEGATSFNVTTLSAGNYIVRVTTRAMNATYSHHYLKLVKK